MPRISSFFGIITASAIDLWRSSLSGISPRTKNKLLVVMHV